MNKLRSDSNIFNTYLFLLGKRDSSREIVEINIQRKYFPRKDLLHRKYQLLTILTFTSLRSFIRCKLLKASWKALVDVHINDRKRGQKPTGYKKNANFLVSL